MISQFIFQNINWNISVFLPLQNKPILTPIVIDTKLTPIVIC